MGTAGLLAGGLGLGLGLPAGLPAAVAVGVTDHARVGVSGVGTVSPFGPARIGSTGPSGRTHAASRPGARSSGPAAQSGTLWVATNGTDGTNTCRLKVNPCLTIAHAIAEAPTLATINLASGTYAEQVSVPSPAGGAPGDDLSFVGQGRHNTFIQPASFATSYADPDSSGVPVFPVVDAMPGTTVNLDNLTLDGSSAKGQLQSCSDDVVGVYYDGASGTVASDTVRNIELTTPDDGSLFGCQAGQGIYAVTDGAAPSDVKVRYTVVNSYQKNGITCDDAGTICSVTNSTVTGSGPNPYIAQNGIQGYESSLTLTKNTVSANSYTDPQGTGYTASGVLLYDDSASTVSGTTVTSDDTGVFAYADGSAPAGYTLSITNNTANKATDDYPDGIDLYGTDTGTVSGNHSNNDPEYGIGLYSATGASIVDNTTNGNGVGILLDPNSTGNSLSGNTATKDKSYDYQDQSSGTGTAGTANTWSSNVCHPAGDSNPEGLCGVSTSGRA